jgi:hypothetical protein
VIVLARLVALCAAAACGHSEPFTTPGTGTDTTRTPGSPAQLTYSPGDDRTASWLPDGSGIVYSTERLDTPDHDRCLAVLPATGGTIRQLLCETQPTHADSTDRFESPAVNAEGTLAAVRIVSRIGAQKGTGTASPGEIIVAPQMTLGAARIVHSIRYLSPDGLQHEMVAGLAWLSPTRLVWVGQDLFWEGSTFFPDTFTTGLGVVRAELLADGGVDLAPVPNTQWASSVAAGPTPDEIYVTIGGEPRVYRVAIATGARAVVYEDPGGEIVRDVQVRGDRLVAVIGRSVLARFEPAHNGEFVQRDEGGDLLVVNLATGERERIALTDSLYRRPALSPDGNALVVERSPFAPVHDQPQSDYTATNHRPDLVSFRFR